MPATTRHEHFHDTLITLLETQDDVRVAHVDDPTGDWPYCYPWVAGGDSYDAVRDESRRPIVDANGRGDYPGSCEFHVWAFCKVTRDTARAGTLRVAMARVADTLERALKYGAGIEQLTTDEFTLLIREVRPILTFWTPPEGEEEGTVQISGYIDYIQRDL